MNDNKNLRPWVQADVEHFIQQHASQYQEMSFEELEAKVFTLVDFH